MKKYRKKNFNGFLLFNGKSWKEIKITEIISDVFSR